MSTASDITSKNTGDRSWRDWSLMMQTVIALEWRKNFIGYSMELLKW